MENIMSKAEDFESRSVEGLFKEFNTYKIPMYQRNYAWGEGEIQQLIQDVDDMRNKNASQPYYIGTIVVFERSDGSLEVIDGQQRLTTLTLLILCLKKFKTESVQSIDPKLTLTFENRPFSENTLNKLNKGDHPDNFIGTEYNADLLNGFRLLEKGLTRLGAGLDGFCEYLFKNVKVTQVPVPHDTDLNHYFEAMNTRGEQLEKHEILKARLMEKLDRDDQVVFSKVWDATANMERYIQTQFESTVREQLFGTDWMEFKPGGFSELSTSLNAQEPDSNDKKNTLTLADIIAKPPEGNGNKETNKGKRNPERFNTLINFPNFLLQVLQLWTYSNEAGIEDAENGEDSRKVSLDDKYLISEFEKYLLKSGDQANGESIKRKITSFAFTLLKSKYLFDNYVIKRDFSDDKQGWHLQKYKKSGGSGNYVHSFGSDEETGAELGINKKLLMLLSAMHVSFAAQSNKYWLNGALRILHNMRLVSGDDYLTELETLARRFVYNRALTSSKSEYIDMIYGPSKLASRRVEEERLCYQTIENNFVFNYLDYLIWKDERKERDRKEKSEFRDSEFYKVIDDFEFTFRSSVEHFYPQHPMSGNKKLDDSVLHSFGNLCLISHSKNSKLSNINPAGKRDHFQAAINKRKIDSLKLYMMIKLMGDGSWEEAHIDSHQQAMVTLFEEDLNSQTGILAWKYGPREA